jgi:hypothetical protein
MEWWLVIVLGLAALAGVGLWRRSRKTTDATPQRFGGGGRR